MRWSYRRLKEEVDRLAAGLITLGLKPGDRLGIWAPNPAEWALTQFATADSPPVSVPLASLDS